MSDIVLKDCFKKKGGVHMLNLLSTLHKTNIDRNTIVLYPTTYGICLPFPAGFCV